MNKGTEFAIGQRWIGQRHPPFLIAELSGNHKQSLERALAIVDAAADAGAHAVKLQTYTADTMTLDLTEGEFFISDQKSPWHGRSLFDLYLEAHTPWDWHPALFERAEKRGLIAFSTPFDATAVDFLEDLDVPAYKIASFENTDLALIRKAAATGKPLIISTGMASLSELHEAVAAARDAGCRNLMLLKCTSSYPASPEDSDLLTIPHMRELFGCEVGLSDHTLGFGAAIASVALGATAVEKHLTLNRSDGGVDAAFSLEPHEMSILRRESERAYQALGRVNYGASAAERTSRIFRRSLYVVDDIAQGEAFSPKNIRAIRPGFGLPPKYLDVFMGQIARRAIKRGTPLSWDILF
jgi:N-acetylneuraminate synthase